MSFASLRTPVSPEFGVAVRVALDGNELFHAGGPTFVQRALPIARGLALVAAAIDVGHGVGAALDVGAVQEGAAVVADLLCSVQYQVGFSTVGPAEKKKNKRWMPTSHFTMQTTSFPGCIACTGAPVFCFHTLHF